MIESLFFELLQVAIGTRRSLSCTPSANQWAELFTLSKKQTLVAVAFYGVKTLSDSFLPLQSSEQRGQKSLEDECPDNGLCCGIEELTYLKWLGLTAKIAQKNKHLSETCASLCKDLAHDGLYSCILKGQSNLAFYPENLRECRTPGDIDVWCSPMDPEGIDIAVENHHGKGTHYEKFQGERGVIEWVLADWRMKGKKTPVVQYHHVDWEYNGVECEVHFKPSWLNCPWHNWRLQQWFKDNQQWNACDFEGFNIPATSFNVIYQLVHIYRHLFNEGVGLRQLLDYYFVLCAFHIEQGEISDRSDDVQRWANTDGKSASSNEEVMKILGRIGLDKFAGAVMFVLQEVFAMPDAYMICAIDETRGKSLLDEIMRAGNFGKYDDRNVITADEGYLRRFIRRQKRFVRFLKQYPSEVIWGPYFSVKQRMWRMWNGWR